jgi:hypothetical protein
MYAQENFIKDYLKIIEYLETNRKNAADINIKKLLDRDYKLDYINQLHIYRELDKTMSRKNTSDVIKKYPIKYWSDYRIFNKYLYMTYNTDTPEVIKNLERLKHIKEADQTYIRESLAVHYNRKGKTRQTIDSIKEAILLTTDNELFLYYNSIFEGSRKALKSRASSFIITFLSIMLITLLGICFAAGGMTTNTNTYKPNFLPPEIHIPITNPIIDPNYYLNFK